LVEGVRIIREAVGAGFKPVFVFYSEDFAPKEVLPLEEDSCYQVPEPIIKAISSTVTPSRHSGRFPLPGASAPGRLGTGCGPGWGPKPRKSGGSDAHCCGRRGGFLKPNAPWEELRSLLQGKQILLADPQGPVPYFAVDWTAPSVLVIGGEARGATSEARQLAHQIVSIPMARPIESLNAAVAAGIILYEAFRQRLLSRPC